MRGRTRALGTLLCCAGMLLCAASPTAAQHRASELRNRLVRRPKANASAPERPEANAPAPAGAGAPQCDPFSRAYAFAPGLSAADEFYPGERSGIVLAIGLGTQFSGVGAHAAWYARVAHTRFWIAPYAGGGAQTLGGDYGWTFAPTAGVMGMWGLDDRWVLDASFGGLGAMKLDLHGATVATRVVHGVTLAAGYEWMARHGTLFRALLGATYMTDAGSAYDFDERMGVGLTLGFGWKP